MKEPAVIVSDHALIRWLERSHGIDMEFFRRQIAEAVRSTVGCGATKCSVDGVTFVLEGFKVVTVIDGRSPMASKLKGRTLNGRSVRARQ